MNEAQPVQVWRDDTTVIAIGVNNTSDFQPPNLHPLNTNLTYETPAKTSDVDLTSTF